MQQKPQQGDYPVDQKDADEFQRLAVQDDLFNKHLPLLPPGLEPPKRVLDIACGTGGWLRKIAQRFPGCECVGLDKNAMLLERASLLARRMGSPVEYRQGDMFQLPKIFRNKQFDLIHMRSSTWFLGDRKREVFAECEKLLAPDGTFCVIDFEQPYPTSSAAIREYGHLFFETLKQRGTSFQGTAEFPVLFNALGFKNIHLEAAVLNLSAGAPARQGFIDDVKGSIHVFGKMIIGSGLLSEEKYEVLQQQCIRDIDAPDFGMLAYFLLISGQKA